MARTAKPARRKPPRRGALAAGAGALGGWIGRNPVASAMGAALLIATCAVGANALWYQPHAHRGALLATRDFVRTAEPGETASEPETTFLIERPAAPAAPVAAPAADPTITAVQRILADLKFYDGKIDGLPGPATGRAISRYRSKVGLAAGTGIDGDLLIQLGIQPTTSSIAPSPAPRPAASKAVDRTELVRRIQAGLKQFGNSGIDIDGIVGQKTKSGIRDFQSMFGLAATGEADEAVYAKMREIGLVD